MEKKANTKTAKAAERETAKEAVQKVAVVETVPAAEKVAEAAAKEPAKKAAAKTAEPKKTAVKKTAAKKEDTKKEQVKPEIFIQYQGKEAVLADVVEKAKQQFTAEGHRASSIKTVQVYLKPEEFAAYYVINQKFAGKVDLF